MLETIYKKYTEIKKKEKRILLWNMGVSFIAFDNDAEICAKVLALPLDSVSGVRKTEFPRNAINIYLPQLLRAGYKVAVAEEH